MSASGQNSAGGAVELKVLLVDDSPTNLRVTGASLERLGCSVRTAASGEEALEAIEVESFSLVMLDYQMPGLNGPETASRIREMLKEAAPPMIALTGDVDIDVFRTCREAGMRLVLKKPLKRDHLEAIVTRLRELDDKAKA